jgi:two-component sensor histidine kinase
MVLCIGLSVDVLLRPAPALQHSSEIGRKRSRPWLLASSITLLAVSLLVMYFIARVVQAARTGTLLTIRTEAIGLFDLVLSGLIAISTLMLGQAILAYEVFTGRALPRRGLARHWRNIMLLAGGYAAVISGSIVISLRPIYSLLLTTLLMVAFYALYSWRSFVERDRFMRRLRPFVGSQHLLTQLIHAHDDHFSRANELFHATCSDVLRAERGLLVPLGVFTPLVGTSLVYPEGQNASQIEPPPDIASSILPLDPDRYDGFCWVIPLWTERGLIGALFVGSKTDGSVYSQEEIEVAQASGERILDMLAGEQIARRLMQIQRRRLAETRVMDFRTRRILHDETLPALHEAILQLSSAKSETSTAQEIISTLSQIHQQISAIIRLPAVLPAQSGEATDLREVLLMMFNTEFAQSFDDIEWQLGDQPVNIHDPLVSEVLLGACRELIRNAAVHGRGPDSRRPLCLTITLERGDALYIHFADNGVGLNNTRPLENMGGSGLDLHRALLAVIGGECVLESGQAGGTQATIIVPWPQP